MYNVCVMSEVSRRVISHTDGNLETEGEKKLSDGMRQAEDMCRQHGSSVLTCTLELGIHGKDRLFKYCLT